MLGLLLARKGVKVTLLEMHRDFDREFRGDTIHPSIVEILDQIGLAEKLHQIPHTRVSGPTLQFANGSISPFNLARLKTKFGYILLVPQAKFLEFIYRRGAKCPGFELVMHANVNQLIEHNGKVGGVRYADDDGIHEVQALLSVGADGRFSQMRRLGGFEAVKTSPPMDVLWFRLPKLQGEPEISGGAFGGIAGEEFWCCWSVPATGRRSGVSRNCRASRRFQGVRLEASAGEEFWCCWSVPATGREVWCFPRVSIKSCMHRVLQRCGKKSRQSTLGLRDMQKC